jgi:hypothetical protein
MAEDAWRLSLVKKDKIQHFLAGFFIALLGFVLPICYGAGMVALLFSFVLVYLWAITKEVLDKVSGLGTCDPYDFIWTLNGWFLVVGLYTLFIIYISLPHIAIVWRLHI